MDGNGRSGIRWTSKRSRIMGIRAWSTGGCFGFIECCDTPKLETPTTTRGALRFRYSLARERFLERSAADQFWARSQAQAIVQGTQAVDIIPPGLAIGAYVGFAASLLITLFGLTIVVRQAARPYAEVEDDDE